MLETFVAMSVIVVLVLILGVVWRRMGRSVCAFYVFIIYCAVDMIMLLSIGMVIQKPLSVWKIVVGFFFPPPFSFVFLI